MPRPAEPSVLSPEDFIRIGQALFGAAWQTPLAHALGVNDRHVRYLAKGERPVHAGLANDLADLCTRRSKELGDLAAQILTGGPLKG